MSEFSEKNATVMHSTGYDVGTWRDGVVGSGVPVDSVVFHFKMRAGDMASYLIAVKGNREAEVKIGVRLKSRREVSRLVGLLAKYADELWPQDGAQV